MRSRALRAGLLFLLVLGPAADDATDEYLEVIRTIRCDCGCHPQSVEACACGRAEELRAIIRGQTMGRNGAEPLTAEAIIARYVAEHGEQIRIAPAATGFNLIAWLGPLVGLVLGLFAAIALVRHLARGRAGMPVEALAGIPPGDVAAPISTDDPYRKRLRDQLEERD